MKKIIKPVAYCFGQEIFVEDGEYFRMYEDLSEQMREHEIDFIRNEAIAQVEYEETEENGATLQIVYANETMQYHIRFKGFLAKDGEVRSYFISPISVTLYNKTYYYSKHIFNVIKPKKDWRIYAKFSDAF